MQPDEIIAIKQEIIASVCKIISGLIDDTKRQFERTRQDVIEAPGECSQDMTLQNKNQDTLLMPCKND